MAIGLVVLHHTFTQTNPSLFWHRPIAFGFPGVWGVNCFFVLSGFLLGQPYFRSLLAGSPLPSMRRFYLRRFLRIYPLYLVAVALSVLIVRVGLDKTPSWGDVVAHIFMLHCLWVAACESTINSSLWTMAVDTCFYVTLPIGAALLETVISRKSRATRLTLLVQALILIFVASVIYRAVSYASHPMTPYPIDSIFNVRNFFGMLGTFSLGLGLALFVAAGLRVSERIASVAVIIGMSMLLFGMMVQIDKPEAYGAAATMVLRCTALDPFAAISCSLLLLGLLHSTNKNLEGFIRSPIIATLAGLSYAVYLFHFPVIRAVQHRLLGDAAGNLGLIEVSVVSTVILVPLSMGMYKFVETPFLRIKNSQSDKAQNAEIGKASHNTQPSVVM